ncbi:MAG: FAD-binding oxidoreductase [Actinomycetes bacterium]
MTIETDAASLKSGRALPFTEGASAAAVAVRDRCGECVHLPGEEGYELGRVPWNVAVDQRPAAVARVRTVEEIASVVRAAAEHGLRVAPEGTGHGVGATAGRDLADVILLRTDLMREVSIDAGRRTARAAAGALWQDVVAPAAEHGLAALHGSSPDVGVCGYTLGGGIGWYARKLGLACNAVTAVELVTAGGDVVRATATEHADLFWAVRGGGGNFGVVTALEFRLFPIADAYAGMMMWDLRQAEPVLRRWIEWAAQTPDEVTTSLRFMRLPPLPELPDFLRGRQLVVIDGAVLSDDASAEALLAPLRELAPELDTFARVPQAALIRLHMDPEGPTPAVGAGMLLDAFDDDAIQAFLAAAGPGVETSLLAAELRQLGGALARREPDAGALAALTGTYAAYFVGIAASPEMAARGTVDAAAMVAALGRWDSGAQYLNLADTPVDVRDAYDTADWIRLRGLRGTVDPAGRILANHPIPGRKPVDTFADPDSDAADAAAAG